MSKKNFECIICYQSFEHNQANNTNCAHGSHGPYCHTCYNNITSPEHPTCSICRGPLTRSKNPNPEYAGTSNTNQSNTNQPNNNINNYIIVGVINEGNYNQQIDQIVNNQPNPINQPNQFVNQDNRFNTPERVRREVDPELLIQELGYNKRRRTGTGIGTRIGLPNSPLSPLVFNNF